MIVTLVALLILSPPHGAPSIGDRQDCQTAAACRTEAEAAASRQDYETFHDLAWKTMQKSPRNDTAVMTMLARAMSLSGRPGDALVMLQRLAALGVRTDAATNDDFKRVRALAGWDEFERGAEALPVAPPPAPDAPPGVVTPAAAVPALPPGSTASGDAAEAVTFTTAPFTPAGLAYDRVSARFLVGDRDASRLTVVDEASHRVATLAAAQTAGFGQLAAFEIDRRQGDLWVASVSTGSDATSTLHKLQLVSGRVLYAVPAPSDSGAVRFVDVAVTDASSVLVLDAEGKRIFVARPKARTLDLAATLALDAPASVAPSGSAVAYVAHAGGIARVDLSTGRSTALRAPAGESLTGIARVRADGRSLVAIQRTDAGSYRVAVLTLDKAGRRVTRVTTLDDGLAMPDPTAASLMGDDWYYLAAPATPSAASDETPPPVVVRRVRIR